MTALCFNNVFLIAGLINGDIVVYEQPLKKKLRINCKNRTGLYSKGRKVTGLEVYDEQIVCVSTNDSRIRFVNVVTGEILLKIKGHVNTHYLITAVLSPDSKYLLSASEDGNCYFWSSVDVRIQEMTKKNILGRLLTSIKLD